MVRPRLLAWQCVPLFQAATVLLVWGAVARSGLAVGGALGCMLASLVIEGRGPFPRFVVSGGWYRALRRSG